jgi:hypothetical protein
LNEQLKLHQNREFAFDKDILQKFNKNQKEVSQNSQPKKITERF